MEQITKTFLGIYMILLLTFSGISIISASLDASHAEQYVADVANVIEASNFSTDMIDQLRANASAKGYNVTITPIDTNNNGLYDMAEIILEYKYSIPFLNVNDSYHYAKAFAR